MAVQTSEAIEGAPADQRRPAVRGHALALVTVVVWAVTFVSTKVLLVHLAPIEILFFRFVIGFVALALLRPRILHVRGFKEERWFMLAGATGVTVYYLLENIALTFTTASIVGVVVAAAPLFTGVASAVVLKERLRAPFFVGFAVAMAGVCLVSFAGGASGGLVAEGGLGQAGLIGVALALAAAGTWAVYSIVTKKLSTFGYDSILVTRRTFAWGLAFMLPARERAVLRDVEHGGEGAGAGEDEPVHLPRAGAHRAGLGRRAGRPAHPAGRRRSPAHHRRAVPFRAREVARREAAHASESNVGGEKASDSEVRKGFEGAAQAAFPHSARSQKGSRGIAPAHPREARGFLPNSICFLHYTSNRLHGDARDWAASSEGFHRTSFVEWKTRTDVSRETSVRRDAEGCRLRRRSGVEAFAGSTLGTRGQPHGTAVEQRLVDAAQP